MSAQCFLTIAALCLVVGILLGFVVGRARGRNEGWLDHYFKTVRDDRARREKNGQFKQREART